VGAAGVCQTVGLAVSSIKDQLAAGLRHIYPLQGALTGNIGWRNWDGRPKLDIGKGLPGAFNMVGWIGLCAD